MSTVRSRRSSGSLRLRRSSRAGTAGALCSEGEDAMAVLRALAAGCAAAAVVARREARAGGRDACPAPVVAAAPAGRHGGRLELAGGLAATRRRLVADSVAPLRPARERVVLDDEAPPPALLGAAELDPAAPSEATA